LLIIWKRSAEPLIFCEEFEIPAPDSILKLYISEDTGLTYVGKFSLPLIQDRPGETLCLFWVCRAKRLPQFALS
jgi:hypothetical protein